MILTDVNLLVYAYRAEAVHHDNYRRWLETMANGDEPFALSGLVLSGFVRVVTHPRILRPPSPIDDALGFAEDLVDLPNCIMLHPGPRHWGLFARLCRESGAKGNLVPDAYLAALAIEAGCELITTDRDFARFKGLRWRHPLA